MLLLVALGLVVVAALVRWHTTIIQPAPSPAAAARPAGTASATVVRTDVVARQQVPGILGYPVTPPVVNQLSGVVTALARPGAVIRRGEQLYAVNGQPVILFYGGQPAWRTLIVGVGDGADVCELESNLSAVGADPQHTVTVDDHFSPATAAAVARWQSALGLPVTGAVALGQVVFAPGPVRVAADLTGLGADVQPGTAVIATTATTLSVTVNLDPAYQALVHRGSPVTVALPAGAALPGQVTAVSTVATSAATGNSGSTAAPRLRRSRSRSSSTGPAQPVTSTRLPCRSRSSPSKRATPSQCRSPRCSPGPAAATTWSSSPPVAPGASM